MSRFLRLDDTTIIFFPPQSRQSGDLHDPTAVQVTMKRASRLDSRAPTCEEVDAYYEVQGQITVAVEHLVLENLINPLDTTIEVAGEGYVLVGKKKEWAYGRRLFIKWGDEDVRAGADKWVLRHRNIIVAYKENDPKRPNIDLGPVIMQIAEPKVDDLGNIACLRNQDVLDLEVAVDDVVAVAIVQGGSDLPSKLAGHTLAETAMRIMIRFDNLAVAGQL
ncbi:hypothetical protein B0H12DRAFT_1324821 [Mycena haematopus]|nr:hypothetical protein B0H12DRAFT_1324821 [Mycena haematopus]